VLGVTMPEFAVALGARAGREIIDKTGIAGTFDVRVAVPFGFTGPLSAPAAPPPPPPGGPPRNAGVTGPGESATSTDPFEFFGVAQSVAEKLGLKLESGKGPGRFLVIDHVEKPSAN
jgi:uncharacterized protein (TIGR03435 family)